MNYFILKITLIIKHFASLRGFKIMLSFSQRNAEHKLSFRRS